LRRGRTDLREGAGGDQRDLRPKALHRQPRSPKPFTAAAASA
jgi:hypothetical protein